MKPVILSVLLAAAFATSAEATCIGSGNFQSCTDTSGNNYTVNRLGNTTIMNGSNAYTGSTWSQNSMTTGNSTYTTGTDSDGNGWNMNQQRIGSTTIYSGTDSDGNSFSGSCSQFGCN